MIKPNKIQEWIAEIENRPMAAPFIVRTLSARLIELDKINEELRAEVLLLRSDKKIEEYERRIAELEYQVELLRRQVQGSGALPTVREGLLLAYDAEGRLASLAFSQDQLVHGHTLADIQHFTPPHRDDIHLLTAGLHDELLYLFDSGRVDTLRAAELAPAEGEPLDWARPPRIDMRSGERLIAILPITRAPLKAGCVQVSRRGLARRIPREYLQSFLQERSIGKGVRTTSDQPMALALCDPQDVLVLLSRAGFISALPAGRLSITLEERVRLELQDYLVAAFVLQPEQSLLIATENGGFYLQDNPWNDPEDADGSRRRLLLGGARSSAAVIGGAAARAEDWALWLDAAGEVHMLQLAALKRGSARVVSKPPGQPAPSALAFAVWESGSAQESEG